MVLKFWASGSSRTRSTVESAFHRQGANTWFEHNFEHLRIVPFIEEGYYPFGAGIGGCVQIIVWYFFQVVLRRNSVAAGSLILKVHPYPCRETWLVMLSFILGALLEFFILAVVRRR
jgi:hypothetical protein